MEPTTRMKLVEKFKEHGSPQALKQILELDEAEAVERMKKSIELRDVAFAQGQLEKIDDYKDMIEHALK
jgi:hypothetical protein